MDILYIRNKFIFFQKVRLFDSIIHEYLQTLPKIFTCVILFASFFVVLGAKNTIMDEMTEDLIRGNQFVKKLPDKTPPDFTVDRDSKCYLHSLEMSKTEVDIVYGLRNESELRAVMDVGRHGDYRCVQRWCRCTKGRRYGSGHARTIVYQMDARSTRVGYSCPDDHRSPG